jgi:hypothetical protein
LLEIQCTEQVLKKVKVLTERKDLSLSPVDDANDVTGLINNDICCTQISMEENDWQREDCVHRVEAVLYALVKAVG